MSTQRESERIAAIIAKANQVAAIDWLHAILEEHAEPLRQELAKLQNGHKEPGPGVTTVAEMMRVLAIGPAPAAAAVTPVPVKSAKSEGSSSYWAKMTPEERRAEMQRRAKVTLANKAGGPQPKRPRGRPRKAAAAALVEPAKKLHPRDKQHPDHAAWLKVMRDGAKRHWASMTPRKRKQRVDRIVTARQQNREARLAGVVQ